MSRIGLLVLFALFVGCVQEIPIEEIDSETFVESDTSSGSVPAPTPSPMPPEVVKTPQLLQIEPLKAEFATGTGSVTIKVITDIKAHCRYILGGAGFATMTPMEKTDGVEHTQVINDLKDGDVRTYQVKCAEKSNSTEGFAFKYSEISVLKNVVATLPDNPPTPVITSLKFLGGAYHLEWQVDLNTVLGAPDGGFDSFINGIDQGDRSQEIKYSRVFENLDYTQKQCFQIEARWIEYVQSTGSIKGRVSPEVCLEGQAAVDMTAPVITSFGPLEIEYPEQTSTVSLTAQTDEDSTCRYSLSSMLEYKDMTTFGDQTGQKSHTHSLSGLTAGSHNYTIRCADKDMNVSEAKAISFNIKEKVVTPPSSGDLNELRASVRKVLDNNCIACHAPGASQARLFDLTIDVKVLEKIPKFVTPLDPENSYIYKKVTTGTMAKHLPLDADRMTIYNWIKAADGKEEIVLNCAADEAPLDNICVKVGKTVRSYGYRMVTPEEMFIDINDIFKVNLSNKDPITGLAIVPEPRANHGFSNQFGLVSANSVFVSSMEYVANALENALNNKGDFNTVIVPCMGDTVVNCGDQLARTYLPKLFRREVTANELTATRNFFNSAVGSKKEVFINYFKAIIQSPSFLFREEHGSGGYYMANDLGPDTPQINELILIDAKTNQEIQKLPLGATIEINMAGDSEYSIEAKGQNVGSVAFTSTNHQQTESAIPYAFAGDDGTQYYPWSLPIGEHTVSVVAYSASGGTGNKGPAASIKINIIDKPGEAKVSIISSPSSTYALSPYEVASRLSYFVMGSTPDDQLLAAAKDGSILQKSVRIAHADRIMNDYAYKSNSHLAKVFLESIGIKESTLAHEDALSADMYRETVWVTRDVFFNFEQKWTNVFTNNYTYVNQRLADIYGFNVNFNQDWEKVTYPDNKRLGILTHASYLSSSFDGSDIEATNDIRRGINFYEKILCRSLPLPPADVDIDLDPAKELNGCRTENRKNSTLSTEKTCIQCHQHFDRIGMGFEKFNNKGEYREFEKDRPSCSTMEDYYLDGATQFASLPSFAEAVRDNNDVGRCLALKMKSYAYGSKISFDYLKPIFLEMETFQKTMKFKDLIKDIVGHDQFIKRESSDEN